MNRSSATTRQPSTQPSTRVWMFSWKRRKKELKAKLDELLLPYEAVFRMPLVAEFNSTMSVREVERVTERVVDVLQNMGSALAEGLAEGTMDRHDVARTVQKTPSLRYEFGIDQTIDNMETYYEMSRRTFTENVAYLALESCLITRLPDIMTPGRVNRMEGEKVEELALESGDVLAERKMIQTQADLLKNALEICRRHRLRGSGGGGGAVVSYRSTASIVTPGNDSSSSPGGFGWSPSHSWTGPLASELTSVEGSPGETEHGTKPGSNHGRRKSRADVYSQPPPSFKG